MNPRVSLVRLLSVFAFTVSFVATGAAQDEVRPNAQGGFVMQHDVNLVLVDAAVRDGKGRVIGKLKTEDFVLQEDGDVRPVRYLSQAELPIALALVLDRSNSMAQKLGDLRETAAHILGQLKRDDQVAVFAFAQHTEQLVDLTPDREQVAAAIDEVRRPRGGTDITDALYEAITYLKRAAPDKRRVVILISDNEATTRGEHEQDEVIDTAFEFETSIYSLHVDTHDFTDRYMRRGYYRGRSMRQMWAPVHVDHIVEETGGELMESSRFGSLSSGLEELVASLRTRYTLGYKPVGEPDGQTHRILLSLTAKFGERGADYTIAYRRGYRRALVQARSAE